MRSLLPLAALAVLVAAGCGGAAAGGPAAPAAGERASLRMAVFARALEQPVHATAPRNEPGRVYVVEKTGRIVVFVNGRRQAAPFLNLSGQVSTGFEQGLLSLAFHPRYARTRKVYVNYTDVNGDTRVVEYRTNGRRVLTATRRQLLFVDQPYSNHNGGQLAFGPDGLLYIGMGDGGSGGDPENRAQNMGTLLGKLLTLNVDRRGARPRIVGLGLRNPWRFSFDRANGDLYVGDVGQGAREEIHYVRRRSPGLENFGWDVYEGSERFEQKEPSVGRLVFPIAEYGRSLGFSVTGGFVYRGSRVRSARGRYFYGDFGSGIVWSLRVVNGRAVGLRREPFRVPSLSSFGEDARGELYATSLDGVVYRLAP